MSVTTLTVRLPSGAVLTVVGRDAWALDRLMSAGETGCMPITQPAPRWSHYVFKLRKAGLDVETITEPHGGAYAGHHARYVLRTPVTLVQRAAA
jgi:hypothetical protein